MIMDETTIGDFYKEEFDIDEFLNKQTEGNELRDILQSLHEMKNQNANKMSTVLREKTDDVILIAEQLQSLYKKIDNLQSPLSQLKEEIQVLTKRVNDVAQSYDTNTIYSQNIHTSKINLNVIRCYKVILLHTHHIMKTFMTHEVVDFEALERPICKYAFHAYVLHKYLIKDTDALRPSVDVSIKIVLRDSFLIAYNAGISERITRIIDLFVYLGMLDTLKEIVCDDIVKPKVAPIFCEENFRACGSDMNLVYGQALAVLEHDLKLLINIIRNENVDIDVILDCYWNVVDKLLRTNMISITTAGHPNAFFKHFNSTQKYLQEIGKVYGNRDLFKENNSFIEHLKRFNILVYYEIRHQYVSSSFELVIMKCSEFADSKELERVCRPTINQYFLQLKVSIALEVLIDYLFCDKVFIAMICEQFIKSALLLTARYSTWVKECLMGALRTYQRSHELVLVAVRLLNDIKILRFKLTRDYHEIDDAIENNIRKSLQIKFEEDFDSLYKEVSDYVINYHLGKLKEDLKNVSDIPRLYRKTNRSLPQKPSHYIKEAFNDLNILCQLKVRTDNIDTNREIHFGEEHTCILQELLQCSITEYHTMVHSVLNAVFKTEESLKRLKSRNAVADSNASQGSSDEAKIRLQIKLDVEQFAYNVRVFKITELESNLKALLAQIENS